MMTNVYMAISATECHTRSSHPGLGNEGNGNNHQEYPAFEEQMQERSIDNTGP